MDKTEKKIKIKITMENGNTINAELYTDTAPLTVENFVNLIKKNFYDGLVFHRVIPNFMIQGGSPDKTGIGGPGYTIKGEFSSNGFENDLKHDRGIMSMARTSDPDSAGSQFFIMVRHSPHLDGQYAAFGKVTAGMEIVDEIAHTERDIKDHPLKEQKIKSVELL